MTMKQLWKALLAAAAALVCGTGPVAHAQTIYGNVYQPAVSPYIALGFGRGGIAPAINYFGIVQPAAQLNATLNAFPLGGLGAAYGGIGAYGVGGFGVGAFGSYGTSLAAYSAYGPYGPIAGPGGTALATGHPAQFVNYSHYYPQFRSGGIIFPGASGGQGFGVPQGMQQALQPGSTGGRGSSQPSTPSTGATPPRSR
jgi:hypothetical protein